VKADCVHWLIGRIQASRWDRRGYIQGPVRCPFFGSDAMNEYRMMKRSGPRHTRRRPEPRQLNQQLLSLCCATVRNRIAGQARCHPLDQDLDYASKDWISSMVYFMRRSIGVLARREVVPSDEVRHFI
jgi:hypothetical protein